VVVTTPCVSEAQKAASPPTEPSAAEVERLRRELEQCQSKFLSWKERAKSGVDSLRGQVIELTQRLEWAEQRRTAELRSVDGLRSSMTAQADVVHAHMFAAACLLIDSISALLSPSDNAVGAVAVPPFSSPPPQDALVKKLQRTIQDQSDRLKETHHALRRSTNEVQKRVEALQRQDEVIATLKRRIEALETTNVSLEEQLMSMPNVEEWRAAQEELDHQLERSRLEYEARETNLVLQHSNEIQALNAMHEQETRELQRDAQERISQAVQNILASQAQAAASASAQLALQQQQQQHQQQSGSEDAAYLNLLRDYETLNATASAAAKERDVIVNQQNTLLRELQDLFRAIGSGDIVTSASPPSPPRGVGAPDGITVADAIRQIGEQRVRLVALQEDFSRCRREVVQLKRAKPSASPDGLGAQQTQYVRSVVVQLLCSLNDPSVAKRLLPVLSMLLKFSDDDLKVVAKAMPQWAHHR
jgi:predicted nuclease with TOPRIM domain